jgi:hypothetical protein
MIRLVRTCYACPEQYDAFDGDKQVGYLRLRHGEFTVHCPDHDGEEVYSAHPYGDGLFVDEERDYYLRFAVEAIQRWQRGEPTKPPAPDVEYEVDPGGWERVAEWYKK